MYLGSGYLSPQVMSHVGDSDEQVDYTWHSKQVSPSHTVCQLSMSQLIATSKLNTQLLCHLLIPHLFVKGGINFFSRV